MWLVVTAHGLLFVLALLSAFLLAYNFRWGKELDGRVRYWFWDLFLPLACLAVPTKVLVFRWTRQYRGSWRYVGLRDLFGVTSASLVGSFLFLSAYFLLENAWTTAFGRPAINTGPPEYLNQSSVFFLDWACTIAFVCAARILVRFYYEEFSPRGTVDPSRVLIIGAGDTGEAVLREILRMRRERYHCVGFLDDGVAQLGGRIHDVEVIGRTAEIRGVCERLDVHEVWIALPHAGPRAMRTLVERCQGMQVQFRTIPAVSDVLEGRVQVSQVRNVDIADLLGREAVQLDIEKIGDQLRGKRILVTGAGGSIGSEMCRQIATFAPKRLILIEQAENNLFEIDRELRKAHPGLDVVPYVADITDRPRIGTIFAREQPSSVFHAAAHKHVPMMEINPSEAIKNNVAGTMTVAETAIEQGVAKMVVVSTDKAVRPTSIMGCSKRVAELFVQSLSGKGATQFVTVRFGNVLGSSGSVVPIFAEQIAGGGPVTVTHPEMMRFFMTIPEAAQLVLQAGVMGHGGEIYTLHMGEPIKIVDLARDMITLSGLRPGADIEIVFTGKRPGEKLYEELAHEGEDVGETAHPKIGIWKHRPADLGHLAEDIARLIDAADSSSAAALRALLQQLVPEYTPDNGGDDSKPQVHPLGFGRAPVVGPTAPSAHRQ
jgi:FlaA1/EpsC-like NDP-sugar epimerase